MENAAVSIPLPESRTDKFIVSPTMDFLLLGGASLILFPLLMNLFPSQGLMGTGLLPIVMTILLYGNYLINFPHFAYSYQLLYQNFGKKITGQVDPLLRRRYIFSGIVVPVLLVAFLAFGAMQNSTMIIKHSVNIMLLSAGWHYAKQGFGILIVTSAYKKIFYSAPERKFLLANAHLMWIFAWILFNTGSKEKEYFGITFATLGFPNIVAQVLGGLVALSTAVLVVVFLKKRRKDGTLPFNGVMAYVASTYLWIILRFGMGYDNPLHPIVMLIPAMHSIQYITIVMRMKGNQVLENQMSKASFVVFILGGILIGAVLFEVLPTLLDKGSFYNKAVYGPTLFMFMFWIFINIHHYFIDNVIWRREGNEPKKFLFTPH